MREFQINVRVDRDATVTAALAIDGRPVTEAPITPSDARAVLAPARGILGPTADSAIGIAEESIRVSVARRVREGADALGERKAALAAWGT
ncbi:MAG: hypothetical protein H0W36_12800 [Gemmatimonadetes bacterium]|nr:hypothetical protein [Gemmatimonadota bacterium]